VRLPNDRKLNVARLRRTFLCAEVDVGRCCRSSNASSAHSSDFKQLPLPKRYAATLARELVWECDYRLWTKHGRLGTRPTCLELERAYALLSGPPPINGRGRPIFSGIGPADRADARTLLARSLVSAQQTKQQSNPATRGPTSTASSGVATRQQQPCKPAPLSTPRSEKR